MQTALDRLFEIAAPSPYLVGRQITAADLAMPVTIRMMTRLAEHFGAEVTCSESGWLAEIESIPSVERSLRIAGDALETWLAEFSRG
jgi:glutathione S-transferase